jgi:choline dehydrogenase-like flavoprotein
MMRDGFKSAVEPLFDVWPLQPAGVLNGSHVCDTCRFGDDPRTSVLDRDNRALDLENLYVLDASLLSVERRHQSEPDDSRQQPASQR